MMMSHNDNTGHDKQKLKLEPVVTSVDLAISLLFIALILTGLYINQ